MAGFGAAANGGALDILFDGETLRSFNGRAREAISGGQFVTVSGAANVIGSTASSFNPGSIVVSLMPADHNQVVGIALKNTGSNEIVPVATRGMFISTVGGVVSGGYPVFAGSATVQYVGAAVGVAGSIQPCGRAITASASGTNLFALINYSF